MSDDAHIRATIRRRGAPGRVEASGEFDGTRDNVLGEPGARSTR